DKRPYTDIGQFSDDLASNEALAISFFNHLGSETTGDLAGLFPASGPDLSYQTGPLNTTMQQLADALGRAAASDQLEFGGADLINASDGAPHLLILSETMPDGFLLDAAVASINRGDGDVSVGPGPLWGLAEPQESFGSVASQLVLRLAERNLSLVFDALQAVDDPHLALRAGSTAEWGEMLVALTLPELTGDASLSTEAAIWIVDLAGGFELNEEQAKAVDQIIFTRPTMLVQGRMADTYLVAAGLDTEGTYLSLGPEATVQALLRIMEAKQGDYLLLLEENMVSVMVETALAVGFYPLAETTAYGMIDGTIEGAYLTVSLEDVRSAEALDARFRSLPDTTIGAGLGAVKEGVKLSPTFVEGIQIDQAMWHDVDPMSFPSTDDGELSYYQALVKKELEHDLNDAVQLIVALADAGNLVEEGTDSLFTRTDFEDYLERYENRLVSTKLHVVDAEGQPVPKSSNSDSDFEPLTVEQWIRSLRAYSTARKVELSFAHRQSNE
ncbi:MAG: hypothetical protein GY773_29520, partial [Actinomycetia bacterium]|nr:hypothetical protein [Actinomycetes bacterium]